MLPAVQVRYLKVIEKSGYQALPWVRYITTGGEYEIRCAHPGRLSISPVACFSHARQSRMLQIRQLHV